MPAPPAEILPASTEYGPIVTDAEVLDGAEDTDVEELEVGRSASGDLVFARVLEVGMARPVPSRRTTMEGRRSWSYDKLLVSSFQFGLENRRMAYAYGRRKTVE